MTEKRAAQSPPQKAPEKPETKIEMANLAPQSEEAEARGMQSTNSGNCQPQGPHENGEEEVLDISSINITSLKTQGGRLAERSGHAIFIQEHSSTLPEIAAWAADARKKGWEVRATPCGPNQAGRGSGVGALVRQPLQIIPWKATTEDYQQVHDLGRAALYKL